MLVLFKRNDILGFLILVFVAFIMRLAFFFNPPAIAELGDFYIGTFGKFNWLHSFYAFAPRTYIFFSTLFWLGVSVYFKQVLTNEKLVYQRDFTPAVALIMVTAAMSSAVIFSVAALSAVSGFVALGVALGTPYNKPARSRYFVVGFFIGLAAALYWPAALLFVAVLFIVLGIRMFVIQEILAMLLGLLFPVYLITTLRYVGTGQWFSIEQLAIGLQLPVAVLHPVSTGVQASLLIIITFYGLYISRNKIVDNKIQVIKKWNGVLLFLVISLLIGATGSFFPATAFVFVLVPFSIILSSALINNNQKYNTFTFYFVLIVVLALQWVLRFI